MMDAEKLRSIYNDRFLTEKMGWTSTDLRKTLRFARKTSAFLKRIGHSKIGGRLLDVGCANGYYSEAFRLLGYSVVGLDYAEVVVKKAAMKFPQCEFVHMNGFEPKFNENFHVILCKGFSGTNTHDITFIAGWVNKYMNYLAPGGVFILSSSSDFSGHEREGEMINLSRMELGKLAGLINGQYCGLNYFYYFGQLSRLKKAIERKVFGKKVKEIYSLYIKKKES